MIYEFKNNETNEIIEKNFSIGKCPKFITKNKKKYHRIYSNVIVIMDPDKPKTLGGYLDKRKQTDEKRGKLIKKETQKPWWRKSNKPSTDLLKLSPEKQERYIMTGEK